MQNLLNKRVLITGATSGIGRCLTIKLAAAGAKMAICGRSEEKMALLMQEPEIKESTEVFVKTFSVTDEKEIVDFVAESAQKFSGLDYLINCAGANSARGNVSEIRTADLDYMISVNLRAPFIFMREAFNIMAKDQKGTIVNILSTVCLFSNEGIGAYTASKAGMDALTKVFRKEALKSGIKVCSVYPGGVNTTFRDAVRPDYLSPESVADSILAFLTLPLEVAVHEMVLRPMVETNF
jgi:NADP-dependent 3-hydroxy acid dehydrogenase YdfG